jgi:hypothetical protein
LYTERPWPPPLVTVLGVLTGPVADLEMLRADHLGAVMRMRTGATTATAWLEGRIAQGGTKAAAVYMREAQMACARAVRAYDRIRGKGPSVAPCDDEDQG